LPQQTDFGTCGDAASRLKAACLTGRMPAADTCAAGGTASWLTIPASTLMHSSVCPRASERAPVRVAFGPRLGHWAVSRTAGFRLRYA